MRAPTSSPRFLLFLITLALILGGLAMPAMPCPMIAADASREISVRVAPDTDRIVRATLFKSEGEERSCMAYFQVELSAFPSSRLATRPAEIAAAIREVADEWNVERCTVYVNHENDTKDEFAEHELCLQGEFRFDKGDYWSVSSENYCWEPSDLEITINPEDITDLAY